MGINPAPLLIMGINPVPLLITALLKATAVSGTH